jgi:hypothetical protein
MRLPPPPTNFHRISSSRLSALPALARMCVPSRVPTGYPALTAGIGDAGVSWLRKASESLGRFPHEWLFGKGDDAEGLP